MGEPVAHPGECEHGYQFHDNCADCCLEKANTENARLRGALEDVEENCDEGYFRVVARKALAGPKGGED
ncbi:MAG: hypothetical protein V3W32_06860 [Gemmatimonadota bacterium]